MSVPSEMFWVLTRLCVTYIICNSDIFKVRCAGLFYFIIIMVLLVIMEALSFM